VTRRSRQRSAFGYVIRLVGLCGLAVPGLAQDISLNRAGSGARAAGMGNAFIAVSDDGTAASWNPAGLSQLRQPEFSLVHTTSDRTLSHEGYRTRDQAAAYTTLATANSTANIEFASAALPLSIGGKPITLQAGWRRLYVLSARIQGDTSRVSLSPPFAEESVVRMENTTDGDIGLWSFAGAVRLTSRLSLGMTFDLYRGDWQETSNTSEVPGVAGSTDFSSFMTTNKVEGHNLNFGLLLAYPAFRIGAVYHQGFWSDYEGRQSVRSSLAEPLQASVAPGARVRLPQSLGAGVAWRPQPLLRLALDFTYDEWRDFLTDRVEGGTDRVVSGFDGLPPELSATRNTVTVNAGLERLFPVKGRYLPLRLGASYEPQGARDPYRREDCNHYILAAGTGINSNSLKFDVAVSYRWGSYANSFDLRPVYRLGLAGDYGLPPSPETTGDLRVGEWRIKVSVIYRLTDTEGLKGVLKKVFGS